jgi:hypothetical protein|tara:strand:+ start:319 stop:468 length:150 start_codon:yes stop_codon:yes gene_type:complete
MPKVGNKNYAYTPKGMAEAEKARKKKRAASLKRSAASKARSKKMDNRNK